MGCACPDNTPTDIGRHPCYSADAQHKFARLHLPVAPRCNISCNYCNRKFDCVNESRPGVTSEVLSPAMGLEKFAWVKAKLDNLSVVGIAGPGDALANWEETKKTFRLIKQQDPDIIFCLSTNGLMLPDYADEIVELGVKHITVTVNCIAPEIGEKIYRYVVYNGGYFTGTEAARLLLEKQLEGIALLVKAGVLVKINIVMIPGVNDKHIPAVVKKMKELGVFVTNIMPMIPAPGSKFQDFPQTSMQAVNAMRDLCQLDIRQMRHCRQCRADAVGLLGDDRSDEFRLCSQQSAASTVVPAAAEYRIAVTSRYGKLVDMHFGHTTNFLIYKCSGDRFEHVETRVCDKYCAGPTDCSEPDIKEAVARYLTDCDAVLTMRIGYAARQRLLKHGIQAIESCYTVEHGLRLAVDELTKNKNEVIA